VGLAGRMLLAVMDALSGRFAKTASSRESLKNNDLP
jgi:hypothetical protein